MEIDFGKAKYLKIAMNLILEEPNTHHLYIDRVNHLCSAFLFHYRTFISDEYNLDINLYIPTENHIYSSDFKDIAKTFALFYDFNILHSKIIELPSYDFECLDEVDTENEHQG